MNISAPIGRIFGLRQAAKPEQTKPHDDFRALVGGGGWKSLPLAVQRRFEALAAHAGATQYQGNMAVKRSKLGWFFAQLCRLLGNPLVTLAHDAVPVDVNVFKVKNGGMCWQRVYAFPGQKPLTVQSVKVVDPKRGLLECIGGGLGMRLRVFEENEILHFVSSSYFMQVGRVHIPIPLLITPGRVHVEHVHITDKLFRFRLSFEHPWFGVTFFQDGVFKNRLDADN